MNDNWATPALDEFCNEYFKSPKDAGFSQQKEGNTQQKEGNTHYKVSQPKVLWTFPATNVFKWSRTR